MKILLLEDDPSTSDVLAATLTTQRYAVDAIADGAVGLDLASRWPYDLLIVDWLLPSMNGPEVCRRLRAEGSCIPILMLTVRDSTDDIVAGLDAGADDYLAKGCDAAQLLARVRALLRRGTAAPVLAWGELCLDPALTQVTYRGQPVPCRPKEYELLELLLRHPQRLLTRSAIIDHLWPMDETPVEGSVTNLMKDLRQRLRLAGLTDSPVETVYGLGYRLKPSPQGDRSETCAAPPALTEAPAPAMPPRLDGVMQRATERFQHSLAQRLALLEGAIEAVGAGTASPQQQQRASAEAHKLAGGLGLFGSTEAAEAAAAIEALLQRPQPSPLLTQRLADLKRSLALPLG